MTTSATKRIFSAIQPTGTLHLGNYLGALKRFPEYQNAGDHECVFAVADLHAITVDIDPADLRRSILLTAATMVAAGVDPEKSVLFVQSDNPHHAELAQLLGCVARVGQLDRMHHFRDKTGPDVPRARVGLYAYPVLMAADILAYRTTHVPVASDQNQHIDFCRDVAKAFNSAYGEMLVRPEGLIADIKVMSLQDGTAKMSKSDPSDRTRINLNDSDDEIRRKFRKAKAEEAKLPASRHELLYDADGKFGGRPEAYNLLSMHAGLAGTTLDESIGQFAGLGFADLKGVLADLAVAEIAPVRDKIAELTGNPESLREILRAGAAKAYAMTAEVVPEARAAIGLGY